MTPDALEPHPVGAGDLFAHLWAVASSDVGTLTACEDLEQDRPSGDAARGPRFDWIVTPVLDAPLGAHRWTHMGAVELSRRHGSRVVSCSSTLDSSRASPPGYGATCALLLDHAAGERSLLLSERDLEGAGGVAVTPWLPEAWEEYGTHRESTAR